MAATTNQVIVAQEPSGLVGVPVVASVNIPQGTMVFAVAASGLATNSIAGGANHFLGIARGQADNSSGGNSDKTVEVFQTGVFQLEGSGFTQALVGDKIYAVDNFAVNATATSQTLVGRVTEFVSSTKIMVRLETGIQA
jgi:hypothetical protein